MGLDQFTTKNRDLFLANFRALAVQFPWTGEHCEIGSLALDFPSLGLQRVLVVAARGEDRSVTLIAAFAHARFDRRRAQDGDERIQHAIAALAPRASGDSGDATQSDDGTDDVEALGPVIALLDRDDEEVPVQEHHVWLLARAAGAFIVMGIRHPDALTDETRGQVVESIFDDDDLEVVASAPAVRAPTHRVDEGAFFDPSYQDSIQPFDEPARPAAAPPRVGRNDPCPCGSGRKYKKCCMGTERDPAAVVRETDLEGTDLGTGLDFDPGFELDPALEARQRRDPWHDLDEAVVDRLFDFALATFDDDWDASMQAFEMEEAELGLGVPWCLFGEDVDGRPVGRHFLDSKSVRCSADERAWIESQLASWLSVWEVDAVTPGEGLVLVDQLSGERRSVVERSASFGLVRRDCVLARIVDHDGRSLVCGLHPMPLLPDLAADVVRRARGRLRRTTDVPIERLRTADFGAYLIRRWEEAVYEQEERATRRPRLQNEDGDTIQFVTDHYAFDAGRRETVLERVAALEAARVEPARPEGAGPGAGSSVARVVLHKLDAAFDASDDRVASTVVATLDVSESILCVEANSIARADEVRARLETVLADLARFVERRIEEAFAPRLVEDRSEPEQVTGDELSEEERFEIVRTFKQRHYATWPDTQLPALDGRTPREAGATADGRRAVDVLLRSIENCEQRLDERERFDVGSLRRELGLHE